MKNVVVAGYILSALLYLWTWLRPEGGENNGLLQWVSFSKLALAEFLTVHAATLLAAVVLAGQLHAGDTELRAIFWVLAAAYALFAVGAYFMHGSRRALFTFYLLVAIRASDFLTLDSADPDAMRAEVLKNFMMSVPMMLLVAGISMSDDGLRPWQEGFLKSATLGQRIVRGRAMLMVSAYYALWALVELKFPDRIAN